MSHLLYFAVLTAAMLGLARILPGFHVASWVSAVFAAVVLAAVNAVVRPVLFILTLPFTIITLGLFLVFLNAMMLRLTAWIVPGFSLSGTGTTLLASLILAAVSMAWKSIAAGAAEPEDPAPRR
ncbi:MAG TPA: phage holin family protein [Candidatus Eisenbacteria bacterium]|jgi:putative membrane protein